MQCMARHGGEWSHQAPRRCARRPQTATQQFHAKLEAVGFGALIPFFFVSTGMSLDVRSFVTSPETLARVPVFLAALLIVRGLPAH